MRKEKEWPVVLKELIEAMVSGEAVHAAKAFSRLEAAVRLGETGGDSSLHGVWESFIDLLRRRGYFVSTSSEIKSALEEIRAVGPGFDLYDLASALAHCDPTVSEQVGVPMRRRFPALESFATNGAKSDGQKEAPS